MRLFMMLLILLGLALRAEAGTPWVDTRYPRKDVTLIFLFEACSNVGMTSKGQIPYFDCESYVYGVLDTYLSIRSNIALNERACFPATLPPWRALEIAEPLMLGEKSAQPAGPVIIDALRKEFPCH